MPQLGASMITSLMMNFAEKTRLYELSFLLFVDTEMVPVVQLLPTEQKAHGYNP